MILGGESTIIDYQAPFDQGFTLCLKEVRANIFTSQLMSYLCQKCKKIGVTDFVSEIKRVENYPDFEKLAHVLQHGLQGFTD